MSLFECRCFSVNRVRAFVTGGGMSKVILAISRTSLRIFEARSSFLGEAMMGAFCMPEALAVGTGVFCVPKASEARAAFEAPATAKALAVSEAPAAAKAVGAFGALANSRAGRTGHASRVGCVGRAGKRIRKLSLACVIIGTPGDGESTKPLSHATKTSLDQQFSERRPEFASRVWAHYTSPKFLSSGLFGGFTGSLSGVFGMLAAPATAKAVSA